MLHCDDNALHAEPPIDTTAREVMTQARRSRRSCCARALHRDFPSMDHGYWKIARLAVERFNVFRLLPHRAAVYAAGLLPEARRA
ncbi:hypothetical protein DYQ48_01135 [Xanthomonas hortorum]|nr:hypothetical protein XGA_3870 [Xanthomonas hortorum ATCC 19865]QEW13836.1 hypothetical protein DYQ48_01135 [Xanthomonas hortorum]